MNARSVVKWTGYAVWLIGLTVLFAYLTFPVDRVRAYAEHRLSKKLGADVEIGELQIHGLSGVELFDVSIEKRSTAKPDAPDPAGEVGPDDAEAKKGPKVSVTEIGRLKVETALLDMMGEGDKELKVEIEAFGGGIPEATVSISGDEVVVDVPAIESMSLGRIGMLQDMLPYEMNGQLKGTANVTWRGSLDKSVADLDITVDGAVVKQPVIESQAYGNIKFTDIDLGQLLVQLKVDKKSEISELRAVPGLADATVIHFAKLEADGADANIRVDERSLVTLRDGAPAAQSALSLQMAFLLRDAFYDKTQKGDDGAMETPNRFLRTIMSTDKRFKAAQKNGYYGLTCRGLLGKPDCSLARPNMRIGALRRPTTPTEPTAGRGATGGAGGDAATDSGAGGRAADRMAIPGDKPKAKRGRRDRDREDLRARADDRGAKASARAKDKRGGSNSARERLEELRRQREDRMKQLREERKRLGKLREEATRDDEPLDDEPEGEEEFIEDEEEFIEDEEEFIEEDPEPEGALEDPEPEAPEGDFEEDY